ncbi:hypothetical protein HPB50_021867 [Hyalomma asiaticum]|uniref:Uncharacterized protein n=1 Tax=Hyalomma asiaticum TaxID=266040 RepID=A0ACB7T0H8_HYAAI|nr:hypothetical protein HPB50_021867 [Hyalomma asiaticum]
MGLHAVELAPEYIEKAGIKIDPSKDLLKGRLGYYPVPLLSQLLTAVVRVPVKLLDRIPEGRKRAVIFVCLDTVYYYNSRSCISTIAGGGFVYREADTCQTAALGEYPSEKENRIISIVTLRALPVLSALVAMSENPEVQGVVQKRPQSPSLPEATEPRKSAEGGPEPSQPNPVPSASDCLASLENLKSPFTGAPLHFDLPCTADENQVCQIMQHISTWNEFLFQARMEIRQVAGARGQLSVISFDCRELPDFGKAQMHQTATLLYWLLSTHHCVRSFSGNPSRFKSYKWLFCDALLKSSSVEIMKLQFARLHVCKDVCKIIAAANHVKELELQSDGLSSAGVQSALSTLLKTTKVLAVLTIPDVGMGGKHADMFLTSLVANNSLKELSMHESALSEASVAVRARFTEYLKTNDTLTALSVGKGNELWYQYSFVPTSLSLKWILQGLLANQTVSSLKLTHMVVDRQSALLLCRLLKENRVLRCFSLTSSMTDMHFQLRPAYDCWIDALAENEWLQELTLPFRVWEVRKWEGFFNIMSRKKNLASMTISIGMPDYAHLPQLCKFIRDSGIENRLPSLPHITSARLDIWTGDMTLAWAFTDYMESSSTLRKLRLWLGSDGNSTRDASGWRAAILGSLSRSKSIRVLHVTSMYMAAQDVCLLANSVTSSYNIEQVHFGTVTFLESAALVHRLSLGAATNYTLLSISLDYPLDTETAGYLFTVYDVARRNYGLVALAAQFVTGALRGRQVHSTHVEALSARALERVSGHPALLELLSELTSVSTAEAATMVRRCLRSIESMQQFMRLAGVVSERVTCGARGDGCVQLADLNEHCWSHIRRYLKLYDVVYDDAASGEVREQRD